MYESWYFDKYDEYNDLSREDFEIFGLKSQELDTRLWPLERLDGNNVLAWIEDSAIFNPGHGNLRLLLTRHKMHKQYEIKPWYMAFEKGTFRAISSAWKLPSDYLFLRKSGAACGSYSKKTEIDEHGSISHLGCTIRVPHSPRNNAKAIWSMTMSWDASNGHIGALFEGVSDVDIQQVQQYLQAKHEMIAHPYLLPTMILEFLNTFFIDHRREIERSLYLLELQLGITRGKGQTDVWDWNYEDYRVSTKSCNDVYTNLVYLERRLEFAVGLSEFLLEQLTWIETEGLLVGQHNLKLSIPSKMLKETLQNNNSFAKRALHQTLCLQKRCQSLTTVLYMVIAQQDSKVNVKIARAAKRDSSAMTAIAVLGFTFLPAMLVASMFSMSMFDFSGSSSVGGGAFVTSKFWMYWAVTVPLTLVVLVIWKIWMAFQRDALERDGYSLKKERTVALESMREMSLALDTPFYPRKGAPRPIF